MNKKCVFCNNNINTEIYFYKFNKLKQNNKSYNVNIICDNCFNNKKFIIINDITSVNFTNTTYYLYDKNIYIKKKSMTEYQRNVELQKKIKELKLNNVDNNICNEYIAFGQSDLDSVLKQIIDIKELENNRLFELINKLRKKNYEYDERIPSYKKYIKHGGDLNKIIKDGELEKILIENTEYLSLIGIIDSDIAQDISINELLHKNITNDKINKYANNKNTLHFD